MDMNTSFMFLHIVHIHIDMFLKIYLLVSVGVLKILRYAFKNILVGRSFMDMNTRCHFVRDAIIFGDIRLSFVFSNEQLYQGIGKTIILFSTSQVGHSRSSHFNLREVLSLLYIFILYLFLFSNILLDILVIFGRYWLYWPILNRFEWIYKRESLEKQCCIYLIFWKISKKPKTFNTPKTISAFFTPIPAGYLHKY